ncbi:MAG: DUF2089 domain-containing protein [Tissierellia bacterium]|nr:DUF2089 domain-containing protein [Tissierellia bacterium]
MDEQKKILEMIENGKITSVEAMELLDALGASSVTEENVNSIDGGAGKKISYKFLKIRVTSENNTVNVNVNIPIRLIKILGGIAFKMSAVIPKDAKEQMESNGIDISNINFAEIVDELLSGTLDDPNIVDVEAWDDEHNTTIKVKIYAE